MPLPPLEENGFLPPGIHAASLAEVRERFGSGAEARVRQFELLRLIVEAARHYPTIKRILVWGSFVTGKPEPNDLDYSVIVSLTHELSVAAPEHRRFFVPFDARRHYGVDRGYLIIKDYPFEEYADRLEATMLTRERKVVGIVELSVRGEFAEVTP